jgi:hypothetical protein
MVHRFKSMPSKAPVRTHTSPQHVHDWRCAREQNSNRKPAPELCTVPYIAKTTTKVKNLVNLVLDVWEHWRYSEFQKAIAF